MQQANVYAHCVECRVVIIVAGPQSAGHYVHPIDKTIICDQCWIKLWQSKYKQVSEGKGPIIKQ